LVLAAHGAVLGGFGFGTPAPLVLPPDTPEPATPILLAPPLRPPKPKPAAHHRLHVAPPSAVAARQAPAPVVAPLQIADAQNLRGPLAPLPGDGASDAGDPLDLGNPPPDLTAQAPAGHYPINPGYWQVDERWLLLSRKERYCVEPWNITRFMAAPCNHLYHCDYPVQRIEADRFHFSGVIWRHDERYNVTGGGVYSPTHLHLSVTGAGHFRILPFAFNASLDGQYLGADCPADAKRIRQAGDPAPPPPAAG
jgi:hypothetical protein